MEGSWKAPIDFVTFYLVLLAGIELGCVGYFNFSPIAWVFGSWKTGVYIAAGVSALWQCTRQRMWR